jgi:hypothetical protein
MRNILVVLFCISFLFAQQEKLVFSPTDISQLKEYTITQNLLFVNYIEGFAQKIKVVEIPSGKEKYTYSIANTFHPVTIEGISPSQDLIVSCDKTKIIQISSQGIYSVIQEIPSGSANTIPLAVETTYTVTSNRRTLEVTRTTENVSIFIKDGWFHKMQKSIPNTSLPVYWEKERKILIYTISNNILTTTY